MLGFGLAPALARAAPTEFNIPAQPAADALLAFSKQAKIEVLFSFDDLTQAQANAVVGRYEPMAAIVALLRGSGFVARRNGAEKFVVMAATAPAGSIRGRLLAPDGVPAPVVRVRLNRLRSSTLTDAKGEFSFESVPPGTYELFVSATGFQILEITGIHVERGRNVTLETSPSSRPAT